MSKEEKIKKFSEKDIHNNVKNKINPEFKKKHSKHPKGYIYLNGKLVGKIKLPNPHKKIMYENKSQYIARALKLTNKQFNELIECTLNGKKYYKIIEPIVL